MAQIFVLDQHTAELIAAGEVVERPASVAKELLENAVDAGATQISLRIERGGISLLEVSDNGSGIESEYISKAFIRHATSKIRTENDLEHILTLGFRGEALASIASVAKVKVVTCTEQDEFAISYRIEGGQEYGVEADARPIGTTITVRDLFYNTPARMKFLKKDASEGTFVGEVISRIALSYPYISFSFYKDGKLQFKTPGDGNLKSAVYSILGKSFAQNLIAVHWESDGYKISGYITTPAECRASRSMQFFFVNGRYIKNKTMMAALENAYKGTLMTGKYPGCVLMLDMPPELLDVNVHPAKTEVRFSRESDVFNCVYQGVKVAVQSPEYSERKFEFTHEQAKNPDKTADNVSAAAEDVIVNRKPKVDYQSYKPAIKPAFNHVDSTLAINADEVGITYGSGLGHSLSVPTEASMKPDKHTEADESAWKGLLHSQKEIFKPIDYSADESVLDLRPEENETESQSETKAQVQVSACIDVASEQMSLLTDEKREQLVYIGEVFKTYIVAQYGDEICFIDKHAAHERMIYEQIRSAYGDVGSQVLLKPITVSLSADEKEAVLANLSLLEEAGIELEDFGGSTVLLRAVPADVVIEDVSGLVVELADKLSQGIKDTLNEKTEWVLHSISCRAAMKAGDKTNPQPLMDIARKVIYEEIPPFCPHGRPVVLKLTKKELEKQFGRLGS